MCLLYTTFKENASSLICSLGFALMDLNERMRHAVNAVEIENIQFLVNSCTIYTLDLQNFIKNERYYQEKRLDAEQLLSKVNDFKAALHEEGLGLGCQPEAERIT